MGCGYCSGSVGFGLLVSVLAVVIAVWVRRHLLDARVAVGLLGAQALAQNLLESEAEVLAEQSVDARVDGRVAVAQPEEDGEEDRRDALFAEGPDDVHSEERHPAAYESADDDAQRLGGFGLHLEALHLGLDVAPVEFVHRFARSRSARGPLVVERIAG